MKEKFFKDGRYADKLTKYREIVDADRIYYVNYEGKVRKCKILRMTQDVITHVDDKQGNKRDEKITTLKIAGIGEVTFNNKGMDSYKTPRHWCPTIYEDEFTARRGGTYSYAGKSLCSAYLHKKARLESGLKCEQSNLIAYAWTWHECASRQLTKLPGKDGKYGCTSMMYDYLTGEFTIKLADGWYLTKEACDEAHEFDFDVVEFEDEEPDEDDFAEQKREEFRDYVAHHCPGFEDRIDWEYFMNLKSMPENLAMQVENWMQQ